MLRHEARPFGRQSGLTCGSADGAPRVFPGGRCNPPTLVSGCLLLQHPLALSCNTCGRSQRLKVFSWPMAKMNLTVVTWKTDLLRVQRLEHL